MGSQPVDSWDLRFHTDALLVWCEQEVSECETLAADNVMSVDHAPSQIHCIRSFARAIEPVLNL